MKRILTVSKRRKRLTNVAVNLERYVKQPINKQPINKQPINKRQINIIISSDDNHNDGEESEKKASSANDDDDDDSVYGCKNNENRKPPEKEEEQTGKRGVRSCRKKAQNYRYDDYDKKFKDALIDSGVNKKLIEIDSGI